MQKREKSVDTTGSEIKINKATNYVNVYNVANKKDKKRRNRKPKKKL